MRGDDPDPRDDVFALGVIWWQILTGELGAGRPGGTRWSRRLAEKGMSAALIDLLLTCFEEEPSDRSATAGTLVKALQQALAEKQTQPITVPSIPVVSAAPQSASPTLRPAIAVKRPLVTSKECTIRAASIDFPFVYVLAGPFQMGSNDYSDEQPVHTMSVEAFWLGKTPVTNAQFRPFVESDGYTNQAFWTNAGWQWRTSNKITQPGDKQWNTPQHPVVGVSWYEAMAYVAWLVQATGQSIRLPTEAEWEKGARGTDGRKYPWGNEAPRINRCNFKNNEGQTTPVGKYPDSASPYGALDMAGNVWEWTTTKWIRSYEDYANLVDNDKAGDATRTLRGGAWGDNANLVRSTYRFWYGPHFRNDNVGFRVVMLAPGG